MFVLGMMARPSRQLAEAHGTQLPAQGLFGDRQAELVPDPLCQIDQPPANDPVDRRDWPTLDNPDKGLALRLVEPRCLTRRLAVDKTIRPCRVEPQHPVTHRLSANAANARRVAPRTAVLDRRQCQQSTALIGVLCLTRQRPNRRSVEIASKRNRRSHGKPHPFAIFNQKKADSGISKMSLSQRDLVLEAPTGRIKG